MMPMQHDTPGETTYPSGTENDWRTTGEIPVPGKTMANIAVVTRNYPALAEQWESLGPLVDTLGLTTKGITVFPDVEVKDLAAKHGVMNHGAGAGRPAIDPAIKLCDTVLTLSGSSTGGLATASATRHKASDGSIHRRLPASCGREIVR